MRFRFCLAVWCSSFAPVFLRLINTPEAIRPAAVGYLRIYFLSLFSVVSYNLGSGVIRALGDSRTPLSDFCRLSRQAGIELYEMDLLSAGEDYYAAMRRSTNGGGENSPLLVGEDDYYELFLEELAGM